MINKQNNILIIAIVIFSIVMLDASDNKVKPVTPNASPEAQALLDFFYSISGKYILTGQHNYPNVKDRNSQFAAKYIGKIPVVWSTDMGFAKPGDTDSYLARPDIVKEAIRQHQLGSIITICWHAVPPTADEPVTFRPEFGKKVPPESLASVQGQLLDQQFQDILTPGTELYKRWAAQVDTVAFYLKKLRNAKVPILWRPYHEMNGDWFWWGARTGAYSTKALYLQLFDRYVNHHKLNNLIWIWSVDRAHKEEMYYSKYYPGNNYLDIVALDVYGRDFNQVYYDSLVALSKGKPMVLGEVGNPPTPDILDIQPRWCYYVTWANMVRNTLKKDYEVLMNDPRVINKEDQAYIDAVAQYRKICGLKSLKEVLAEKNKPDYSGFWIFNEEKSQLDNWGISFLPSKMIIKQRENLLIIEKRFVVEYESDHVRIDTLTLDRKENKSLADYWNAPQIITAHWSDSKDTLLIETKVVYVQGGQSIESLTKEKWLLQENGKVLVNNLYSKSRWGERNLTLVFYKW
jgi:mannan endo-1,4-beta-mannosidase